MSRIEKEIESDDDVPIDAREILEALAADSVESRRRQRAVARYLSGADGWKEAFHLLDGAFAPPVAKKDG